MQWLYLAAAALGTVLPLRYGVAFVLEHGLDLRLFVSQMFETDVSALFAIDVVVSSVVVWLLVYAEGRRLGMRHLWAYVVCNLVVGVSLALPLFLWMRQRRLTAEGA
jgi:hypothetical protein